MQLFLALTVLAAGGCSTSYQRVAAGAALIAGGGMVVKPVAPISHLPAGARQNRWEDVWTRNGPQLDRMALLGGLPDGKAVIFQAPTADQRVPVFRADMTSQDLVSMIEVAYRVMGVTVFEIESVEPVAFLGGSGIKVRYDYASGIVFAKKGVCVMRIVDGKLYAMKLDGIANRGFAPVAREFDLLVASATLRE